MLLLLLCFLLDFVYKFIEFDLITFFGGIEDLADLVLSVCVNLEAKSLEFTVFSSIESVPGGTFDALCIYPIILRFLGNSRIEIL